MKYLNLQGASSQGQPGHNGFQMFMYNVTDLALLTYVLFMVFVDIVGMGWSGISLQPIKDTLGQSPKPSSAMGLPQCLLQKRTGEKDTRNT